VHHVVVDSPTGPSWGFVGSGPADTARSVLLAPLDEDALCQTCRGTGYLTADNADTIGPGATSTARTACTDCDRGYRHVPYRLFTTDHVAHWGEQWCMTRQQAGLARRPPSRLTQTLTLENPHNPFRGAATALQWPHHHL